MKAFVDFIIGKQEAWFVHELEEGTKIVCCAAAYHQRASCFFFFFFFWLVSFSCLSFHLQITLHFRNVMSKKTASFTLGPS